MISQWTMKMEVIKTWNTDYKTQNTEYRIRNRKNSRLKVEQAPWGSFRIWIQKIKSFLPPLEKVEYQLFQDEIVHCMRCCITINSNKNKLA